VPGDHAGLQSCGDQYIAVGLRIWYLFDRRRLHTPPLQLWLDSQRCAAFVHDITTPMGGLVEPLVDIVLLIFTLSSLAPVDFPLVVAELFTVSWWSVAFVGAVIKKL
jgi:hypothetical protein